jgi:hypothetical protein
MRVSVVVKTAQFHPIVDVSILAVNVINDVHKICVVGPLRFKICVHTTHLLRVRVLGSGGQTVRQSRKKEEDCRCLLPAIVFSLVTPRVGE